MLSNNMTVLIVGTGNREKALDETLKKSPRVGNSVMTPWTKVDDVVTTAQNGGIDLVIVGPEAPLVAGLVETLMEVGIAAVGPSAAAARLEGSKLFGREIATEAKIAIPKYHEINSERDAERIITREDLPIVVKRDGLAGGKGVTVAETANQALAKVSRGLPFGPMLLEQCLQGDEVSAFFACDGTNAEYIGAACDKKRLLEDDKGPNTGGMGAWSPARQLTPELLSVIQGYADRTLTAMRRRNTPFRGILYLGLMLVKVGETIIPHLIEYNVRFGDPEAQVILPLMDFDIFDILLGTLVEGGLEGMPIPRFKSGAAVCITLAGKDYPEKGSRIGSIVGTGPTHEAARVAAYWKISGLGRSVLNDVRFRTDIALGV